MRKDALETNKVVKRLVNLVRGSFPMDFVPQILFGTVMSFESCSLNGHLDVSGDGCESNEKIQLFLPKRVEEPKPRARKQQHPTPTFTGSIKSGKGAKCYFFLIHKNDREENVALVRLYLL